jgi:hypothetical protein
MGIFAAENIIQPGTHNLWDVNSDSDYAEEVSAIATKSNPVRILLKQFYNYFSTAGFATIVDVSIFSILVQSGGFALVPALVVS